ncbi:MULTISPECIES: NUDIX hydrolase [Terrabacteria group]|uniref:NUDIX hydrolase n=1 Tax=Bacillati TaxID=1783272 RepID=UPI001C6E693C|nr:MULTISPECIES: NUDIX hydrolase [Terrabacteria group]MBW9212993.1 NUDIX hydrolase [Trueperella sp. zg.1013]
MKRTDLIQQLKEFIPFNEQEEKDKQVFLRQLSIDNIFKRENEVGHFTASCWIVNQDYTKVLLAYHNIYQSYAWLGGHCDGDEDCLGVALKEAREESGLENIKVLSQEPISIETLVVNGHEKKGKYIPSHLHFNVTYLFQANDQERLHIKEDENSALAWFDCATFMSEVNEIWMKERIYQKLNGRIIQYFDEKWRGNPQ